jgi:hypothetical protein
MLKPDTILGLVNAAMVNGPRLNFLSPQNAQFLRDFTAKLRFRKGIKYIASCWINHGEGRSARFGRAEASKFSLRDQRVSQA